MGPDFLTIDPRVHDKWETFWKRRQVSIHGDKLFTAEDRIFTVGSCFAFEIKKALMKHGVKCLPDYSDVDVDRSRVRLENDEGVPLFHLQHYNTYTVLAEFERLAGSWTQDEDDHWLVTRGSPWRGKTACQDPYRRRLYGRTADDLHAINATLNAVYRRGFEEATAFFFTFGMTEVFRQKSNGRVVCQRPLYAGGGGLDETEFYMSSYADNLANIERLIAIIRGAKPDAKIVMTVSPVPLARSFSNRDVTIATTESKAILRAVLGEVSRRHDVLYFPSYEAVTWQGIDRVFGGYDNRHVHDEVVHNIMGTFIDTYFDLPADRSISTELTSGPCVTATSPVGDETGTPSPEQIEALDADLHDAGLLLAQGGALAAPRALQLLNRVPDVASSEAAQAVLANVVAALLDAFEKEDLATALSCAELFSETLAEAARTLLSGAFFPDGKVVFAAFDDSAALCYLLLMAIAGRPAIARDLLRAQAEKRDDQRFAASAAVLNSYLDGLIALTSSPDNVVVTCYFNGIVDAQRSYSWPSDTTGVNTLGKSVEALGLPMVVLNDCFTPEAMHDAEFRVHDWARVQPKDGSSSWNRWYVLRDYLIEHEEIGALWMVDSTDTELFRSPFGAMDPATLYVGHEPWDIEEATEWALSVNHTQEVRDWILANPALPMLNCGIVGGDRTAMMTLAEHMIGWRERYPDNGESDNMSFNMLLRTIFPLSFEHGRHIATNFTYYETANICPSIWRHK